LEIFQRDFRCGSLRLTRQAARLTAEVRRRRMQSAKILLTAWVLLLLGLAGAVAQTGTYQAADSRVPFSFDIGDRKFHAGDYEFVVRGQGLMEMRNGNGRVLTTLLTRDLRAEQPGQPRLVF